MLECSCLQIDCSRRYETELATSGDPSRANLPALHSSPAPEIMVTTAFGGPALPACGSLRWFPLPVSLYPSTEDTRILGGCSPEVVTRHGSKPILTTTKGASFGKCRVQRPGLATNSLCALVLPHCNGQTLLTLTSNSNPAGICLCATEVE